ncbi:DarT ssDNA thymidine ADP-ribosyltransferase family protein [Janthinobacterium sp.]|uniref:DarT ssDNA thymidine ADP-ribosyltransferase family protein n=1 Tax=Janthinobacterium sp. TaxID=1871054 RepID=UPI0028968EAA|nr:DarT ssDNA thymidine ADP-ribosyltransferase family protein [Janthinobacterium sp.]
MTIQQIVAARNIRYLCHFTRLENLESILNHGLLPTDWLDRNRIVSIRNDQARFDRTTGICATVSFPNYKLFWPLRSDNPGTEWVVLRIKAEVLWQKNCAFCVRNAAHNEVTGIPLPLRQTTEAFRAMFDDFPGVPRAGLNIPDRYTTNPQAEVLMLEPVELEDIDAIIFDDAALRLKYAAMNLQQQVLHNHVYFSARMDFDKWK